jgi:glutamate--cysteine ligase
MPSPARSLSHDAVRRFVHDHVFAPTPARQVGVELEWFPRTTVRPRRVLTPADLQSRLPDLMPGGSVVTYEPGGQFELSGPCQPGIGAACTAMRLDTRVARDAFARAGIELIGIGVDPDGARPRVVEAPRYRAMEEYFDTRWPDGRTMMRNTAAIQVNLDVGRDRGDVDARWQRAHAIGPVLAAAFANSPFDVEGHVSGWRSTRLAVWHAIDPCRTGAAYVPSVDAVTAWTTYTLDAPVMLMRIDDDRSVALRDPFPFGRWLHDGHALGWPTESDLEYHLTTLFPPVRPRRWLELRMIDALPEEWWPVAVSVTTALLDDPEAAEIATNACAPVRDTWEVAARDALSAGPLREAAGQCFRGALAALPRLGADLDTIEATADYLDRYVVRGRCPADDLLDERAAVHTRAG